MKNSENQKFYRDFINKEIISKIFPKQMQSYKNPILFSKRDKIVEHKIVNLCLEKFCIWCWSFRWCYFPLMIFCIKVFIYVTMHHIVHLFIWFEIHGWWKNRDFSGIFGWYDRWVMNVVWKQEMNTRHCMECRSKGEINFWSWEYHHIKL